MIAQLRGQVEQVAADSIVLGVGGVGFLVRVPARLASLSQVGQELLLPTELLVRQDELALYGFSHGLERELFRLLTSISGVGPKLALRILSGCSPSDLARAIGEEDLSFLVRIPGVGSKTAKRIVVEISEKIQQLVDAASSGLGSSGVFREAEEVLCGWGCSPEEARAALELCCLSPDQSDWTVDALVIEAMKYMGGQK